MGSDRFLRIRSNPIDIIDNWGVEWCYENIYSIDVADELGVIIEIVIDI